MKILAIGDFHGKFPRKLENAAKKKKIDIAVCIGDYLPFTYRKLWFKHCFNKDISLWEVIGKKRYKKLVKGDLKKGERILKKINKLPVPVVSVLGNVDYPEPDDVADPEQIKKSKHDWKLDMDRKDYFSKLIGKYKNVHRVDYSSAKIKGYYFIGMRGHSFPGRVKSKAFRKHKKILDNLFRRLKKENKEGRVIFVSHNVPYNTKLDKIGIKAHNLVRKRHSGSKLARRIIDKWQPILAVAGHIHEGRGMQKLGKTLCINSGEAGKGKYAIVDIDDKGKGKVRFVK